VRASSSYDLVIFGSGFLVRLAGCLVAKAGQRVLRVPLDEPEPEAAQPWPTLWPMDFTAISGPRERALEMGFLVPLRDHLEDRELLGQYVSREGTAELFCDVELLASQTERFPTKSPIISFQKKLLKRRSWELQQSDQSPGGSLFARPRLFRAKPRLSRIPNTKKTLHALDSMVASHPWTSRSDGGLVLGGGRRLDGQVVRDPVHRFLELAEGVSQMDVMEPGMVVDLDMKGKRIEALVTPRGQRIHGSEFLLSGTPRDLPWGPEKRRGQLSASWDEDLGQSWRLIELKLTFAPGQWPPFLVGPLLLEELGVGVSVTSFPDRVVLDARLKDEQAVESLLRELGQFLPWLQLPAPELTMMTLPQRKDPTAPIPSFRDYCSNLLFAPDRLIFGLGINQPFYAAKSLADLFIAP